MDNSRKINVIGDISEDSYRDFAESMDELEGILEGDDIHIELASHGGDALMALAYFDKIRRCKSNVTIVATGLVASAAVLILAAGDKRLMTRNAWVMVHEDTVALEEEMRVTQVEKNAKISRRLEVQWNKLMASRTRLPVSTWARLHEEETYLDATECLNAGLIDKVI